MQSTPETRAMAQEVLDYIHEHPEDHEQADFFGGIYSSKTHCGTTMCIAGTASFLHVIKMTGKDMNGLEAESYLEDIGEDVEALGQRLLGLTFEEKEAVFFEMDNERAIQKLKKVVVGEEFNDDDFKTIDTINEEEGYMTFVPHEDDA